ncbi:hypothetical protein LTR70_004303 [Exophiala xenobiotica]|uniref:Heterokaryon incompatibility domain-containing protein n=1 Tax=Lithohypha guttulata TaxID=1690604 RepID=A0ABR0KE77_9EURO|nr:hypothetical protein LTR24_003730 [Lithohypha guttulata]KAK5321058.1 hypothetical protein LTR70_004303 [Exophiala xenobiotica]
MDNMIWSGDILWLILCILERLLALYAVYHLAEPGIRRLNDQITWWSITAKWWPRHTLPQKASRDGPMLYEALPTHPVCIRLLIIEPDSLDRVVRGRLVIRPLTECTGQYEALSYVWGSTNDQHEIIVNDCSVSVTRNLLDALQGLRPRKEFRVLWIDALCINQDDMEEKGQQVRMMDQIYACAAEIQIWLGQENDSTAHGMLALAHLAAVDGSSANTPPRRFIPVERDGLEDILGRVWFSRVWVAQEAALATKATINVGSQSVSWDKTSIFRFLKRLQYAENMSLWQEGVACDMRNLRDLLELGSRLAGSTIKEDLMGAVHERRHLKCVDPRDHIYANLSLAKDAKDFQVDYTAPVTDVFERLYHYTRIKYKDMWSGLVEPATTRQ